MSAIKPARWVSCAEVAVVVGVARRTVQDWVAGGQVLARRVGPRLYRVAVDETGWPVSA